MSYRQKPIYKAILIALWIVIIAGLAALSVPAQAGCCDRTYVTNNYITEKVINQTVNETDKSAAKSTAAGQHHYKATKDLQWSVGAGYAGDETALSVGLGLQLGNVFMSGNITDTIFSGESDPIIGIGASGTF